MPSFKLIALRPLISCDQSILKKLTADEFYFFDNGFQPSFNRDYIEPSQTDTDFIPENFFYSSDGRDTSLKSINIQALVGKNGDGKSSLTELAIRIFNNFFKFKAVHEVTDNLIYVKGLNAELYFCADKTIYRITVRHYQPGKPYAEFCFKDDRGAIHAVEEENIGGLFFVFNVNYAHYSLNSQEFFHENYVDERHSKITPWLDKIFHRNDGYQTPMTIHPFRYNGNIDVVKEKNLTNQRLISLMLNEETYKKINEDLTVKEIKFENFEAGSFENEIKKITRDFQVREHKDERDEKDDKFFGIINNNLHDTRGNAYFIRLMDAALQNWRPLHFSDKEFLDNHTPPEIEGLLNVEPIEKIKNFLAFLRNEGVIEIMKLLLMCRWFGSRNLLTGKEDKLEDKLTQYLIVKAKKILRYPKYKSVRQRIESGEQSISGISYIRSLLQDDSHITVKFKQVSTIIGLMKRFPGSSLVNFYRDFSENKLESKIISINEFKMLIAEAQEHLRDHEIGMYLNPPGIFKTTIMLTRAGESLPISLNAISSGEFQKIGLISSIIYHLKNLDSIDNRSSNEDISYDKVLLFLDEIELYFHPDFQRLLLNDLISKISEIKFRQIEAINMLFVTHSPFILSDIPKKNVIFLENGLQVFPMTENTFGANIHTLLQHGFFLNGMPIGEFAKRKINQLFTIVNSRENISDYPDLEKEILMVSEPFLRSQLLKAFHERRGTRTIEELIKKVDELEKKIRDNN